MPADSSRTNPTHPGKTLTHRFLPGETTRQVVEPASRHISHVAGEINFSPVTTLNLPEENVYVKPIKNLTPRHISPLPLRGPLKLPIRGERVFDISPDFQRQLQKRLGVVMDPYELAPKPITRAVATPPPPPDQSAFPPPLKVQPPPFSAKPEIAPPVQVTKPIQPTTPPTKEAGLQEFISKPPPPKTTPIVQKPAPPQPPPPPTVIPAVPEAIPPPKPAEPVVTTIPTLVREEAPPPKQTVTTPLPPPQITAPPKVQPAAPAAPLKALPTGKTQPQEDASQVLTRIKQQLSQEVVAKTATQERVAELMDKYQTQIALIIQEKNQLGVQLRELNAKLSQEAKTRIASENRITVATNQLKTEINRLKIERDGLLGQVKNSQNQLRVAKEQQAKASSANVEITQLKAKLAQVEKEKEDTESKVLKYETLINDLRKSKAQPAQAKEVIVPQVVSEKARGFPVKFVHPAPAVGKMAPQLTTIPNVVNGIVKDISGMLLTDVVLVVKDQSGNPVRALKSNKIGQFAISTPLPNGTYTMELEKEGNEFDVVQINLEGKVMPPIEIRAR
jgi:hypothetical protein